VPYGYGGERTARVRLAASHVSLLDVLSLLRLVAHSDDAADTASATVRPEVVVRVRGRRLRRRRIVARRQQVGLLLVVQMVLLLLLLAQATSVRALFDGSAVSFGHFDLVPAINIVYYINNKYVENILYFIINSIIKCTQQPNIGKSRNGTII